MICFKCQTEIDDTSAFCSSCGEPTGISCQKCKKDMKRDSKFCPSCGEKVVKLCSKCRKEVASENKLCSSCGERVVAEEYDAACQKETVMTTPNETGKNTRTTTDAAKKAEADVLLEAQVIKQKGWLEQFAEFARKMGSSGAKDEIEKNINAWKLCPIKIAIIGESGTGKSTFINSIRGIDADDKNAAAVGTTETTTDMQKFPHPVHTNLEFWDVPGVGTPKFPKSTYLTTIEIERYDFFVVTCQSRFKENDVWLAKEIVSLKKRFYFVRTMIDVDVEKDKKAKKNKHDPVKLLEIIRHDCIKQLKEGNVSDPQVFLVDNYSPTEYDFSKLTQQLIRDAPDIKKESLILSLSATSKEMIEEKRLILESRIYRTAFLSAFGALIPIPGSGIAVDFALMQLETAFYKEQLGTDDRTLMNIAKQIGISFEQLKGDISLESCLIFRTQVAFVNFCAGLAAQEVVESIAKFVLPFFGSIVSAFTAYPASVAIQRKLLRLCCDEAYRVLDYQSKWLKKM